MKKHLSNIILIIIFFVGLFVMLYPSISNYVNSKHSSKVISDYNDVITQTDNLKFVELFRQAEDYNKRLADNSAAFFEPSLVSGYDEALNLLGTGIMGYISIPAISVELPIYHGVDDNVLRIAAGHLPGTSLPTGGESTHCVLSGHRGLPSAQLFTDLDDLVIGDVFVITILDRTLTYKIDSIKIVKPTDTEDLQIVSGMDYCTLMTCTPYGVNTHRLLVRGVRIENDKSAPTIYVANEAFKISTFVVMLIFSAPMLFVLLLMLLTKKPKSKNNQKFSIEELKEWARTIQKKEK